MYIYVIYEAILVFHDAILVSHGAILVLPAVACCYGTVIWF